MLRLSHLRRAAVGATAWVDQLQGIHQIATVLTLVTPGAIVAADGAGPLDVTVGQKAPFGHRVELALGLLRQKAVLKQGEKDVLRHPVMIFRVGVGEQVIAEAHRHEQVEETAMVALEQLLRREPLGVGCHGDGCAVAVRARHHQHAIAPQAVKAGIYVGR